MQKRLFLDPALPLAEAIASTFESMLVEARERAEQALDAPHESLHNYRRALRRAEAVLELAGPFLRRTPGAWLGASVARGRRKTRLLRDVDAVTHIIDALEKLELGEAPEGAAPSAEATAPSPLRMLVSAFRDELATPELVAWRLRKNLRSLAGLSSIFRSAIVWIDEEALVESVRISYRAARKAMRKAADKGTAEALHAFRKAARTLRYQLELLASRPDAAAETVDVAGQVATIVARLGDLTDIFALRAMVLSSDRETLKTSPKKVARALETLAEGRTAEIFAIAEVAFATKAGRFLRGPEVPGDDGDDAETTDAVTPSTDVCDDVTAEPVDETAATAENLAQTDD
jgi:CHAD domain-containing protein